MSLTPMDITSQRFRKSLFGFEKQDVRSFLEAAATHLRAVAREKQTLEEENEELKSLLEEYREREKALRETMLSAQRVAEDMKVAAHREAEVIISRAEMSAQRLLEEAQKRQTTMLSEISEIKFRRMQAISEIKSLLEMHLRTLEMYDDIPKKVVVKDVEKNKPEYLLFDKDFDDELLTDLPPAE